MNLPSNPPTCIVFAREPRAGRSKTRLAAEIGEDKALLLAFAFALDTLFKVRQFAPTQTLLALDEFDPRGPDGMLGAAAKRLGIRITAQKGCSLGERMQNALGPFASRGAILIGSDIPSLPIQTLAIASRALEQKPVVLGPAVDGGYYLIGVRGGIPPIFQSIQWSADNVLAKTVELLERKGIPYGLVPTWYDVDRRTDLAVLVGELRFHLDNWRKNPWHRFGALACPTTALALVAFGLMSSP